jgi:hypothetical protein
MLLDCGADREQKSFAISNEGIPFEPGFDAAQDFSGACAAACSSKQPGGLCTVGGAAEECTAACEHALVSVDAGCARAFVDSLYWPTPDIWCNDFECGCDLLFAGYSFQNPTNLDACQASVAYKIRLRQSAPQPEDQGPGPVQEVELQTNEIIGFEPNTAGVFVERRERFTAVASTSFLAWDGTPLWAVTSSPSNYYGLWPAGSEHVAQIAQGAPVRLLDSRGRVSYLRYEAARVVETQFAELLLQEANSLHYLSSNGDELASASWNANAGGGEILELLDGGFLLVSAPTYLLRRDASQELVSAWVAPEEMEGTSAVETEQGIAVVGRRRVASRSYDQFDREPYLLFLDSNGAVLWDWAPDTDDVAGGLDRALYAGGKLFVVSTEDPVTATLRNEVRTPEQGVDDPLLGTCSVYGCTRLVVRQFDLSGQLLAEYHHRSEASSALDAEVYQGDLWVLATFQLETEVFRMLRFKTD